VREGRRERVDGIRGEPDRQDDEQEGEQPRVLAQQPEAVAKAGRALGARRRTGANWQKLSTPSRNAECVNR
jgi:hypothetical protein